MSRINYTSSTVPRLERNHSLSRYGRARFSKRRNVGRGFQTNVGRVERIASLAAGTLLTAIGFSRKGVPGMMLAGVGGGLLFRGATGHCSVYEKLDIDTTKKQLHKVYHGPHPARNGIHVVESVLINKPASELYELWRNFENLPRIMSHIRSVRLLDERQSHWIVDAPRLVGGRVEWDAEIIRDEPNVRIAWRSLPSSQIDQRGMVTFLPASGARGVIVRVDVEYRPPAGQVGHWAAKLLGEDPAQQIHDDLRNLKRTLEIGEVITVAGQPRGTCVQLANGRG